MADMRYSREVGDEEHDIINNQPVAQECLSAGCQCGYRDQEIERLREALIAFRKAKASVGGNSYDGLDEHTRDLLEHADGQADLALGSPFEADSE